MKTVIYIDVLLLVNFLIAAVLLLCAGLFCAQHGALWRVGCGSGMAAIATLILFAPILPFWVQLCYQAGSAALVVFIAYGRLPKRRFFNLLGWYYLFNLLFAGVVTAFLVQSKTTYHGLQTNNLSVYCYISPSVLIACVIGVYLALKIMLFCFSAPHKTKPPQQILLSLCGTELPLCGFYDTGFAVRDPFSNRGVLLLSMPSVQGLLPDALRTAIKSFQQGCASECEAGKDALALRFLPCHTVAGECLLPALCAEYVCHQSTPNRRAQIMVAFCQEAYFGNGCNALFGADLAETLIQEKEFSHGKTT